MSDGPLELWAWNNVFQDRQRSEKPYHRVSLPVGGHRIVGRDPRVDITVTNLAISRQHFEIRRVEDGVWLTDLHTRSGTWLNETKFWDVSTLINLCDSIWAPDVEVRVVPAESVDPSWLQWNDGTVPRIARSIHAERRFEKLPMLHDALLDAGCDNENILTHLRHPGPHVFGCWAIDLLLGQE